MSDSGVRFHTPRGRREVNLFASEFLFGKLASFSRRASPARSSPAPLEAGDHLGRVTAPGHAISRTNAPVVSPDPDPTVAALDAALDPAYLIADGCSWMRRFPLRPPQWLPMMLSSLLRPSLLPSSFLSLLPSSPQPLRSPVSAFFSRRVLTCRLINQQRQLAARPGSSPGRVESPPDGGSTSSRWSSASCRCAPAPPLATRAAPLRLVAAAAGSCTLLQP